MAHLSLESIAVGAELTPFEAPAIDRTRLAGYAAASGDHNPIHLDDAFAREAGFPSVIAHGMLSMGFVAECASRAAGVGAVVALKARFKAVTFPGDSIRVSGRVVCVEKSLSGDTTIECELAAKRADGTTTVEAWATLRIPAGAATTFVNSAAESSQR